MKEGVNKKDADDMKKKLDGISKDILDGKIKVLEG
mgnify:CR=1 FL=1